MRISNARGAQRRGARKLFHHWKFDWATLPAAAGGGSSFSSALHTLVVAATSRIGLEEYATLICEVVQSQRTGDRCDGFRPANQADHLFHSTRSSDGPFFRTGPRQRADAVLAVLGEHESRDSIVSSRFYPPHGRPPGPYDRGKWLAAIDAGRRAVMRNQKQKTDRLNIPGYGVFDYVRLRVALPELL